MSSAAYTNNTIVRRATHRFLRADRGLDSGLLEQLWSQPKTLLNGAKDLQVGAARRTVRFTWGERSYVLKWFGQKSLRHAAKRLFLRSEAEVAWRLSHRLADAGVATPRAIAYVENRVGPLRRHSGLVYPFIEGEVLRDRFSSVAASGDFDQLEPSWANLEAMWGRLQSAMITLGDANVGNFVVTDDNRLWVVDLDRVRVHRTKPVARFRQWVKWRQLHRSIRRITGDTWQPRELPLSTPK